MSEDGSGGRLDAVLRIELPEGSPRHRRRVSPSGDSGPPPSPPRSGSQLRRVLAGLTLVSFLVAGVGLALAGARVVGRSSAGEVLEPVADPDAPGYEAYVEPTPTLAVLHTRDDLLEGLTFLSLPGGDGAGGAVVFVPVRTLVELPELGYNAIEYAHDLGNPEFTREVLGDLLGARVGEFVVVDAARWASLVGPVAPLTIDNPDALTIDAPRSAGPDAEGFSFPAGPVELAPREIGPFLEASADRESDLARLFRHELVWRTWIEAVASSDRSDVIPGETDVGLGRFVRSLAAGPVLYEALPVTQTDDAVDAEGTAFEPDEAAVDDLVARIVPFPQSPRPGIRARARILNGTADVHRAAEVAPEVATLGLEIVVIGNADRLDHEDHEITYFGAEFRPVAERIRDELGGGVLVEQGHASEIVDITVTLGADDGRTLGG